MGLKIVQAQGKKLKIAFFILNKVPCIIALYLVQNSSTYLIFSFVAIIFAFSVSIFTLPIPSGYDLFRLVVFLFRTNGISHKISYIEIVHLMELVKEHLMLKYCVEV
jgi:hypothetical protein